MDAKYQQFLEAKIKVAQKVGITIDRSHLHTSLRPDQMDIAEWALELGAALVAPDAGMGKTRIGIEVMRMLQVRFGGTCLIVTELGASDTFVDADPEVGEAAAMGMRLEYVTNQGMAMGSVCDIVVTNYERVRDGNFDFGAFTAVWLDEGNYVKNMASETTDALKRELVKVKFKYIATATPSPNETLELINYAHVLGICDRGQILTRFFQRNSVKAGELTLHEQHAEDFWLWVSSWCIAVTSPKDLGYDFPGFELPELCLHWVEVPMNKAIDAGVTKDGQARMYIESRTGLSESAKIKNESIDVRVAKAKEIAEQMPNEHFIFWHHLEPERKALKKAVGTGPGYGEIYGKQDWTVREKTIVDFTKGLLKDLGTKPSVSGVGCNFQKHCWNEIFVGITDSFNDIYQAIKRVWRFYNPSEKVNVWLLYTPEEYEIVQNLKRKWREHNEMRDQMRAIIKEYGLNHSRYIEAKRRSFVLERKVWQGENFTMVCNDGVFEMDYMEDNSIHLFNSSFPFGNHYEYTDKYNDFGHNETNADFIKQMDFLLPKQYNKLQPGRIYAVHLKNRIHYGSVTGLGFSIFHRFTHMVCDTMEKHGFQTMGFHYIPTDVVAENNQTYRLTYGELQKDSTKMGAGIPEEIWLFRRPPTTNANAYADLPVIHNMLTCPYCGHTDVIGEFVRKGAVVCDCKKCNVFMPFQELIGHDQDIYTLAHWQIDADGMWRSSGNRYLAPAEIARMDMKTLRKVWNNFNSETIYDYEEHVKLLQTLDAKGKLSRTFTTLPLRSNTPYVWNDVNRMHGLNLEQHRRKQQNHICPQPFDEVDRIIELYSNPGETVGDSFGGLATTGVRAVKKRRKAYIVELNETYAKSGAFYLRQAELKNEIPTLFDTILTA